MTFQKNINLHMCQDEFVVKKRFFTSAVVFIFSHQNTPLQLSLSLKHRKLTNVVE